MAAVAITGAAWPVAPGRRGPFRGSDGYLYAIALNASNQVTAYQSQNSGTTWSALASYTTTAMSGGSLDCVASSESAAATIWALAQTSTHTLAILAFNVGAGTWSRIDSGTAPTVGADAAGRYPAFMCRRSDGSIAAAYQFPIAPTYRRVYVAAVSTTGSWDSGTSRLAATEVDAGGNYHYDLQWACTGLSDRFHILYDNERYSDPYQRSLSSANALDTAASCLATTITNTDRFSIFYLQKAVQADSRLIVSGPTASTTYRAVLRSVQDSQANNTWGQDTNTVGTDEPATCATVFAYDRVSGLLYAFFREYTSDDVYRNSTSTTTWTTAAAVAQDTATAVTAISVTAGRIPVGTDYVIGILYLDSSVYWDSYKVGAQVNAAAETLKWDVRAQVNAAASTLKWDVRAQVNAAAEALVWDVAGSSAVNANTATLKWDTRSQVNASASTLKWDLYAEVGGGADYDTTVLTDGPVGYWPLNESAGVTAEDLSGNNNDGTYTGSYSLGVAGFGDGETSVDFTGGSMSVGDAPALRLGAGAFSIECFFNASSMPSYATLIDNTGRCYSIFLNGSAANKLYLGVGGYNTSWPPMPATLADSLATGNDYHIVLTVAAGDPTTVTCWINGSESATNAWTHGADNSAAGFSLLANPTGGGGLLKGRVAKLALYDLVLTPEQVAAHYAAKTGAGAPAPLTLKWDVRAEADAAAETLKWDLTGQTAAAAEQFLWDLCSQADAIAEQLVWDVNAQTDATAESLVWDLRVQVDAAAETLIWDLAGGPTPVNASAEQLLWDLRAQADAAAERLLWDLRAEAAATAETLLWDLRAQADALAETLKWDLIAQANAALEQLVWDLQAQIDAAAETLIWDLAAQGQVDAAALDLKWDVRAQADAAAEQLVWDLQVQADATAEQLLWDLRAAVAAAIETLIWDLAAEAQPVNATPLTLIWSLWAPGPPTETHPPLAGDYDNQAGGQIPILARGGITDSSARSGILDEQPTGGQPTTLPRGGNVQPSIRGGIHDHTSTGATVYTSIRGGQPRTSIRGGTIKRARGGSIQPSIRGGTHDQTATGGNVLAAVGGGDIETGARGGIHDEAVTGGEVL